MSGGIHHLIAKFITTFTAKCPVKVCSSTVCGAGSGLFTSTTVTKHEVGMHAVSCESKIEIEIGTPVVFREAVDTYDLSSSKY
jgi:hypothetical protein